MMILTPLSVTSCTTDSVDVVNEIIELLLSMLGWNPSTENTQDQEKGDVYNNGDGTIPSSVDLSKYFPPIGNQGSYGTCVVWSSGYALKTAMDAKSKGYTTAQLQNAQYQCSPIDLWHEIPKSGKSTGCNGSNFEPALEAMVSNGVDNLANVPFTNSKMTCDGVTGNGNSANKLAGYRIIAYTKDLQSDGPYGMTVSNFKYYLSKGYPILIGARLGESFMKWNSSSVLKSDTKDYNGQHAYHAIVVTGYDDSKGAFRVRNSWGTSDWGDNGGIWVDYNFFINQFIFGAWIAYNSDQKPSTTSAYHIALKAESANDLSGHVYSDVANSDGTRTLTYDIENNGTSTISSNKNWSVVYVLYNAKNLNEKAILFQDCYTNGVSKSQVYKNGVAVYPSENYATNVTLQSGETMAQTLGGSKMQFTYKIPTEINGKQLNGEYYMAMIVNPFNSLDENNFDNNYCFITGRNNVPLIFRDGKLTNMPSSLCDVRTLTGSHHNTYTGDELVAMLAHQLKNGSLRKLVKTETGLRNSKTVKKIMR